MERGSHLNQEPGGRFRLIEKLNEGNSAKVYIAQDLTDDKEVIMKINDDPGIHRYEAKIMKLLNSK